MFDKDYLLGFLTFLLIILGFTKYQQLEAFYSEQSTVCIINNQVSKPKVYKIKVLGAVKNPGDVYLTQWPPRVYEAIQAAGGLSEMADISKIRPAENLVRAELLTIPFTFEEGVRIIRKQEPTVKSKPKAIVNIEKKPWGSYNYKPYTRKAKLKSNQKVNVNTASIAEISKLPGVGEKLSLRIIEQRSRSKFRKPEDLLKVKGIGKGKLKKISPFILF